MTKPTTRRLRFHLSSLLLLPAIAGLLWTGCAAVTPVPPEVIVDSPAVDSAQLIEDVRTLAAPEMEGRFPGTPGHTRAREYIRERFREIGLQPLRSDYEHRFTFTPRRGDTEMEGVNLVGIIPGTTGEDRAIVVTAHYDHLGIRDGAIYHGADDNASGTAALFAVARYFLQNPPRNDVIIAAVDAEEHGLLGARAFVSDRVVPHDRIVMNVNMDMISRSDRNELYAAGAFHYPFLGEYVVRTAARAPITLLMGHDDPALGPRDDWTMLSDHGAFHEVDIPFIYFGVEDHEDYHRPTDTFENIHPEFYVGAVETVIDFLREVDANLEEIQEAAAAE
jgi:hypothetical protein